MYIKYTNIRVKWLQLNFTISSFLQSMLSSGQEVISFWVGGWVYFHMLLSQDICSVANTDIITFYSTQILLPQL